MICTSTSALALALALSFCLQTRLGTISVNIDVNEVVIDTLKKTSLRNLETKSGLFLNNVVIRALGDTHLRFYYFMRIGCVHIKYCAFKQKQTSNALTNGGLCLCI
jgi:hypothetical protein